MARLRRPGPEWVSAAAVTILAVVLAALDILDGAVHRWWAEHAFTTSLVGGLLVLLVTVLVADRVIHARQLRDRARAIAAQAAIVLTQAVRTVQLADAMLDGNGDVQAAGDALQLLRHDAADRRADADRRDTVAHVPGGGAAAGG